RKRPNHSPQGRGAPQGAPRGLLGDRRGIGSNKRTASLVLLAGPMQADGITAPWFGETSAAPSASSAPRAKLERSAVEKRNLVGPISRRSRVRSPPAPSLSSRRLRA